MTPEQIIREKLRSEAKARHAKRDMSYGFLNEAADTIARLVEERDELKRTVSRLIKQVRHVRRVA